MIASQLICRAAYINYATHVKNKMDLYLVLEQSLKKLGKWGKATCRTMGFEYYRLHKNIGLLSRLYRLSGRTNKKLEKVRPLRGTG